MSIYLKLLFSILDIYRKFVPTTDNRYDNWIVRIAGKNAIYLEQSQNQYQKNITSIIYMITIKVLFIFIPIKSFHINNKQS